MLVRLDSVRVHGLVTVLCEHPSRPLERCGVAVDATRYGASDVDAGHQATSPSRAVRWLRYASQADMARFSCMTMWSRKPRTAGAPVANRSRP